jgi:hypothetical protein
MVAAHELSHLYIPASHGNIKTGYIYSTGDGWQCDSDWSAWDDGDPDNGAVIDRIMRASVRMCIAGPVGEHIGRLVFHEGCPPDFIVPEIANLTRTGALLNSDLARSDRQQVMMEMQTAAQGGVIINVADEAVKLAMPIYEMLVSIGRVDLKYLGIRMYKWQPGQGVQVDLAALANGKLKMRPHKREVTENARAA